MEILHKQLHKMCVSVCEFVWDRGSYYSTRRAAVVTREKIAIQIISESFFWLTGLIRMRGYEYFYQKIAEWLLLSMLISIDSQLQILILYNFVLIFLSLQPLVKHYKRFECHSSIDKCSTQDQTQSMRILLRSRVPINSLVITRLIFHRN